jgi:hypothetical protein
VVRQNIIIIKGGKVMKRKSFMFYVLAIISLVFIASPVSANHLHNGRLTADCEEFSIHVTGNLYVGDKCDVSYELEFDPPLPSGSVKGSFPIPPVTTPYPDKNYGPFDKTFYGEFGDVPCDTYTIKGTASMDCEGDTSKVDLKVKEEIVVCECGEGCTPGYWGNSEPCWCPDIYDEQGNDPSDLDLADVFDNVGLGKLDVSSKSDPLNDSLMDALQYKGGEYRQMFRHCVAALLNACSDKVNAEGDVDGIIGMVNDALLDPDNETTGIAATKGICAGWNEDNPCPINSENAKDPCASKSDEDIEMQRTSLATYGCGTCGSPLCQ